MKQAVLVSPLPVDKYPPVASHAAVLARNGVQVSLLTSTLPGKSTTFFSHPNVNVFAKPLRSSDRVGRVYALFRLAAELSKRRLLGRDAIDLEIAYDPIGVRVSSWAFGKSIKTIHHYHEVVFGDGRRHEAQAIAALTKADLVTVADAGRAALFSQLEPAIREIRTVRNLPLREVAADGQIEKTSEFSVAYFGARGSAQCLDTVVQSMADWPPNVCLHLYGNESPEFDNELRQIARAKGVESRLIFEDWVSPDKLGEKISRHHLGLSLLRPVEAHWKYSAGASNKRFQLMAFGVPQITDDGIGVFELVEGTGACVPPDNANAIAQAVCEYARDPSRVKAEANIARSRIWTELNQENEFEQILEFAGFR